MNLFEESKKYIPGGVNSPVRAFGSVGGDPVFIKRAHGSKVYDINDKEYLDYICSWGPLILGHADEDVVNAVVNAAKNGTSFGAPTELELKLAKKVVENVPSMDMVRMVNSGTEAVMSAIRVARAYTEKDKIIKFEGCYHGHSDGLLVKAGSAALTFGQPSSPGVPDDYAKNTLVAEYNNLDSVKKLVEENKGEVAAVIVEPVAGNMGVVLPKDGFLKDLEEFCKNEGILLIFDEVITGFRLAPGGAGEYFDVDADLTTMGKIIGGGLPVGAYGGKKEIMEMVSPTGPVTQAGTLSGNPLAMAAGLATLDKVCAPGFHKNLAEKSEKLWQGMRDNCRRLNVNYAFNTIESMGCLFFKEGEVTSFKEATSSDTDKFAKFFHGMLKQGITIAPSQFEATFVSDKHSDEDIEYTIKAHYNALKDL
ncbi:Glutamate-1-semialdehyde 2,1-aminomutase [Flexistipes sinusarabici DSM 4947]|uniref:Glutamate-1-semialdehyde 2,1-aminomutase n=2 Tax=Flexistipes sinusarabici TaxID=2352 RepID=F8E9D2_FLESM|nr:glutamate-1-semialdehyde 2,1-aminomutase [Flexistipes sinusarabici]AEI14184.1 Glutamate-1-semialdehyde 2,1-aminomutase [Flexistipes sinusarabici DSM 4947]HCW92730.1 glutamate-1-semialdehyde-2,1-aminomutase [Flexistipes sinusarabici]